MRLLQLLEAITDDMRDKFMCGHCAFLALLLHREFGWPMSGYFDVDYEKTEYNQSLDDPTVEYDDIHHIWVDVPGTGKSIDINGVQNSNELKSHWAGRSGEKEGRGQYSHDVSDDWVESFINRWNSTPQIRNHIYDMAKTAVQELKVELKQGGLTEGPEDFLGEIELPDLEVGDELMVGKFKNRNATIKGFKTDKHNQPIVKTDKGDQQVFKGRVKKLMNQSESTTTEAHNPNVRVKYMSRNDAYYAYLGSTRVGQATVYGYRDDKVGENERYIWKSAVHPDHTRKGVATAMYDEIAKDLEGKGLKLVPSPDTQLSGDAYAFWKSRDPESVKDHGRTKAEPYNHLVGREGHIEHKGQMRPVVIKNIGWSKNHNKPFASYRFTDVPEGSVNSVSTGSLDKLTEASRRQPAMVVKDVFHATHDSGKFDELSVRNDVLFFSKKPRTTEFGKRVFVGDIWFNDPFMFSDIDVYNVESILSTDMAKSVVMNWVSASSWEQIENDPEMLEGHDLYDFISENMLGDDGFWQHPIIIDAMKKAGYDGVISNDPFGGSVEYVIFSDKQFIPKDQFTEDAAIRTYDPGVLEWLQEALSRPDADDLYLHGSSQVQNVFSQEDKRHEHSLLHFSKLTDPRFKDRPHHAEYYGPKLFLCKLSYSKPFDVRYPDKEPAQMYQELVPRGRKYQLDYGDIYHIIEPALAKGYDMFVVWEVSVNTESYAVPEANQVQVIDTYNSREKV
jgi:GNAT superfamily N-acetyltransferase